MRARAMHPGQCFPNIGGDAERQTRDDGAGSEHFRIGRKHHRGHRAAGGQAGDEDSARIDAMIGAHARDHLPDRCGLALTARDVVGVEPVEAAIGVVGELLLRHQQRKAAVLRQRRPAGAEIITSGGLAAAVQHDHERARLLQVSRHKRKHAQVSGIGPELPDFDQRTARGQARTWRRAANAARLG